MINLHLLPTRIALTGGYLSFRVFLFWTRITNRPVLGMNVSFELSLTREGHLTLHVIIHMSSILYRNHLRYNSLSLLSLVL